MVYRQPFRGDYPITQQYGEVIDGVTYQGKPHTGIDYGIPEGTPILASADGTVMMAGESTSGYGKYVIIRHDDGNATLYAHLSRISTRMNWRVGQGDLIGYSGQTGYATGPHLHFEARRRWNDYTSHFDPMQLPLVNFADAPADPVQPEPALKDADAFRAGDVLTVVAPAGAKVFRPDWTIMPYGFPMGTKVHYTGRTAARNGYTYMEVYEDPPKHWVAVHNGDVQILDN